MLNPVPVCISVLRLPFVGDELHSLPKGDENIAISFTEKQNVQDKDPQLSQTCMVCVMIIHGMHYDYPWYANAL